MLNPKKEPALRFREFTGAWEQRKLQDLASIIGGGTPSTSNIEYWNGDIDWYSPTEINDQIYVWGSQKKITQEGLKKSSAQIHPAGTVLFTSRAGIGKTAILGKEGSTNQGFQSILPKEKLLDSYFIFSRTHELKRYGEISGAGSTFVEVSGKEMAQMPILVPVIEEQQKIGQFFKVLDYNIALHQHKYKNLIQIKKALLIQLFPQERTYSPKLRLDGFTNDLGNFTLSDLVEVVRSYSLSRDVETKLDTGYRYIHYGDIHTKKADLIKSDNVLPKIKYGEYDLLKKGDVVVADASEDYIGIAEPSIIVGEPKEKMVAGLHTIALRPHKIDPMYLYYLLHTNEFKKFASQVGTGMKVFGITTKNLLSYEVLIPELEEQKRIGISLEKIDNKISIQKRKYEKLTQIKKALLQEMFI
ncbi:restriction endonuclease subunit S [Listeria grandensis]|uniref:restriction endonuclease subunit S n=1 Tax=Listeria grandensis TaxID=1494963 RepID=UPI0016298507|nr:restriction endonuclease subunit S [Listeria grandensis]MBC1474079.1 restriction endonuclease subunit S [Listeria grandensis]